MGSEAQKKATTSHVVKIALLKAESKSVLHDKREAEMGEEKKRDRQALAEANK